MITKGNPADGRQLIYNASLDAQLKRHLDREGLNYLKEKNQVVFIENVCKYINVTNNIQNKADIEAFLYERACDTEKKKGIERLSNLFYKIRENEFLHADIKKENKERTEKERQAKIQEEIRKQSPEYKIEILKVEIKPLQDKKNQLIDANMNAIDAGIAKRNIHLDGWIERLKNCYLPQTEADTVRNELIWILQAMQRSDYQFLFYVDYAIFRNPAIQSFVKSFPKDADKPSFDDGILGDMHGIADEFEYEFNEVRKKTIAQTLKDNNLEIVQLDKQMHQKQEEIKKLSIKQEEQKVEPVDDEDKELKQAFALSLEKPKQNEQPQAILDERKAERLDNKVQDDKKKIAKKEDVKKISRFHAFLNVLAAPFIAIGKCFANCFKWIANKFKKQQKIKAH